MKTAFRTGRARKIFVIIPALYLVTLLFIAVQRSSARSSVLESGSTEASNTGAISDQLGSLLSRVQLEDFHRVEIKEGKPVWEVRAKDAKYYPREMVTHVNDAGLKIFREKDGTIAVRSAAARLYLGGTSLSRALLDGNIRIKVADEFRIATDSAEFDASKRVFSAPGEVTIEGNGFKVEATGFRFDVEPGVFTFEKNVRCVFKEGATVPQGLNE